MRQPQVSFIVPCFKYAHYLAECVNSILAQTYGDFEILIMDDCSPDSTPEVAKSFTDSRIRYFRNETNLGNVANYNKGIAQARGSYLWLLSADDKLHAPNVLSRYVELLERERRLGYAFCPAIGLKEGNREEVVDWSAWPGTHDRIVSSDEILKRSAYICAVCAPTGLVRRECYTRLGTFPADLKRAGDWYLWALFATRYDAAYFAEPMVCYRLHSSNMEKTLEQEHPEIFYDEELRARWRIKEAAEGQQGFNAVMPHFYLALADAYAWRVARKKVQGSPHGLTFLEATQEIKKSASGAGQAERIVGLLREKLPQILRTAYTTAGARAYCFGQYDEAVTAFRSAAAAKRWSLKPSLYLALVRLEQILGIRIVPWLNRLKIGPFHLVAKNQPLS